MRLYLALATSLIALALPSTASAGAGDADPTFGVGGVAAAPIGVAQPAVNGLAVAPDGSIVVAATDTLVRFTKDGRLDKHFGAGGIVVLQGLDVYAEPVVEPEGGLLVAGSVRTADGSEFAVARFGRDGAPDLNFGNQGVTVVPFLAQGSWAVGVARDAQGRIVAGGTAFEEFAVARLTPDGSLDPEFGDGGANRYPVSPSSRVWGMALDSAGRPVLAGSGTEFDADGHSSQFPLLARVTAEGRLDSGFGSGGVARAPAGSALSQVLIEPDGAIVVAGRGTGSGVPFLRYLPEGSIAADATIHRQGIYGGVALARQNDGKLLVTATNGIERIFGGWALARANPDGSLDRSFGDRGVFSTALGADYWWPSGLGVQPSGGIIVGGTSIQCGRRVVSLIRVQGRSGSRGSGAPAIAACDPVASNHGKRVSVIVDCPIVAAVCKGSVALRHRAVRIGEGRFNLGGHQRYALVRIKPGSAALALLGKNKKLPATATYRVKGKTGRARTVVRRVTVNR